MPNTSQQHPGFPGTTDEKNATDQSPTVQPEQAQYAEVPTPGQPPESGAGDFNTEMRQGEARPQVQAQYQEGRPLERDRLIGRAGARGTAAMDPHTRQEVARKGGLAVSRNKQHMAEIGRKGGQSVSKNKDHMAKIGRKGGAASRGGHHTE